MTESSSNSNSRSNLGRRKREKWSDKTFNKVLLEVIGPILIILMIGSLVYFLIEIFYRGPHAARLGWVLGLFTIAAVLVSRIAIEGGPERALLFGVPLAIATLIVTITLVDFEYGSLAILEPVVVAAFIGIVMWSANRLTWDCTMIDESRDVSSIGLTELVRRKFKTRKNKKKKSVSESNSESVVSTNPSAIEADEEEGLGNRLFFLLFANKKNKNTPGLWVFYFSLAAFPIFGFGQWFAQPTEAWGYRWIFFLFSVYLGSGLGLLMLTSLLGLERYVNKRGAELPTSVSGPWMAIGTVFALAVMLLMLLLPSPSISSGLQNAVAFFTTNSKDTSEHAIGKDGQDQGEKPNNDKVDNNGKDGKKRDGDGGEAKGKGKNGKQKSKAKGNESGGDKKGKSKQSDSKQGDQSKSGKSKDKGKQDKSNSDSKGDDSDKGKSKDKQNDDQKGKQNQDNQKQDNRNRQNQDQNKNNNQAKNNQAQNNRGQRNNPPPPPQAPSSSSGVGKMLADLMKYLVYGLGIAALIVCAYLFREEIAKFWNDLFGGKEEEEEAVAAPEEKKRVEKPLPPFTQFQEPFSSGKAANWSAAQTIQYTFQALEAWGRDSQQPRDQDQTPHEFAKQLGAINGDVAAEARTLADLHGECLFSGGAVDQTQVSKLKRIWKLMTSNPPRRSVDAVGV